MTLCLALTAAGLRITSRDHGAATPHPPPIEPPLLATEAGESIVTELGERLVVEPEP